MLKSKQNTPFSFSFLILFARHLKTKQPVALIPISTSKRFIPNLLGGRRDNTIWQEPSQWMGDEESCYHIVEWQVTGCQKHTAGKYPPRRKSKPLNSSTCRITHTNPNNSVKKNSSSTNFEITTNSRNVLFLNLAVFHYFGAFRTHGPKLKSSPVTISRAFRALCRCLYNFRADLPKSTRRLQETCSIEHKI